MPKGRKRKIDDGGLKEIEEALKNGKKRHQVTFI